MAERIIANENIKAEKVFVVGSDGEKIGEMLTSDAIEKAYDEGLDLVLISMGKGMPTVRIIDKNKYLYEQKQKEKRNKKNSKVLEMKEIRVSANIAANDLATKETAGRKFLEKGHELKFSLLCRGREISRIRTISNILDKIAEDLSDVSDIKMQKKIEGRNAIIILKPKK